MIKEHTTKRLGLWGTTVHTTHVSCSQRVVGTAAHPLSGRLRATPARPSALKATSKHPGRGLRTPLALLAVLHEVFAPHAVHIRYPSGAQDRLAMGGLSRLVVAAGALAIIQEPNACQASCRLGRSLVDINAEQEAARAARQARRGIAQEA